MGHSMAGRIQSMKNLSDRTGNETHDLLAYSVLSQANAPSCTPTNDSTLLQLSANIHYDTDKVLPLIYNKVIFISLYLRLIYHYEVLQ